MAKKEIKEKNVIEAVKESIDNKKEKFATKVLVAITAMAIFGLAVYGIKKIFDCGLSDCYLGGAGIGSIIVGIIWLVVEHLKP